MYENVGKRSGAYSGGAHRAAPFILMNYQDKLRDMFTLAHELGHIFTARAWQCVDVHTVNAAPSDHRPLVADLVPAPGSQVSHTASRGTAAAEGAARR